MRLKSFGIWVIGILFIALALFFFVPEVFKPSSLGLLMIPMIGMALSLAADKKTEYREGVEIEIPCYQYVLIYAGAFVCVNSGGYAVPGDDATGLIFEGIARENADNYPAGASGAITVKVRRRGLFLMTFATAISIANVGDAVFLASDETVDVTGNVTYNIFCGVIAEYVDTTHAWVDIEPAIKADSVDAHIADTSGAHAASAISFADSGNKTTAIEVDGALDEIYVDKLTAQYTIPPTEIRNEDGSALGAFANGATDGWTQMSSKSMAIRWNDGGTPTDLMAQFVIPQDYNDGANVILHLMGTIIKAGGSVADSPKVTVEAYFDEVDAAPGADTDCGGDSSEFTADGTLEEATLTIALANAPAAPTVLTIIFHPKDGELGTDDFVLLVPWLEVTRKLLTS